jgi:hypothetical protein
MLTLSTDGGLLAAGARQFLSSVNRTAPQRPVARGADTRT